MRARNVFPIALIAAAAALTTGCMTPAAAMLDENADSLAQVRVENDATAVIDDAVSAESPSDNQSAATTQDVATVTVTSASGPPAPDTRPETSDPAPTDDSDNADEAEDEIDLPTASDVPGDVNGDGEIDGDDINSLIEHYGLEADAEDGDLNNDGMVNITDLGLLLSMISAD